VAITVEYMNTRKQFGVADRQLPGAAPPHGRRQDAARAGALDELLRQPQARRAAGAAPPRARQAKVQLGHSMRFVGQQCVQLHGGIGVTDEYAASHYFKRLTMLEMGFGDTLHHLGEVSHRMQDTAGVFA
jgi:alkylation response protein AidB-like acyl-CoA dehydrogenase